MKHPGKTEIRKWAEPRQWTIAVSDEPKLTGIVYSSVILDFDASLGVVPVHGGAFALEYLCLMPMKPLQELVRIITRNKRKRLEVLSYSDGATNRHEQLYQLIADGQAPTDQEAAQRLFGPQARGSYKPYRNLCNGLLRRLVNTLFLIDLDRPAFGSALQAAQNCAKRVAAVQLLSTIGARHAAFELAKRSVKPAIKYELNETALTLARFLCRYYALVETDPEKHAYYTALAQRQLQDLQHISWAEGRYLALCVARCRIGKASLGKAGEARACLAELALRLEQCDAYRLHLAYWLIAKLDSASNCEHEHTVKVCRQALQFMAGRPAAQPAHLSEFFGAMSAALTMLACYGEAEAAARQAEVHAAPGSPHWFESLNCRLRLELHREGYAAAGAIFLQAIQHPGWDMLTEAERHAWRLNEACLCLLAEAGWLALPQALCGKTPFKLAKFLNGQPRAAQSEPRLATSPLVLHALFLLQRQKWDEAHARILALDKHAGRHLKAQRQAQRAYCFIKALQQIPKASFSPQAAQAAAADWLGRLAAVPPATQAIEIMPFERLWALAVAALR
jgi:hypothetical protein